MATTETFLNQERLEKILKDGYFELEDELKGYILVPSAITEKPYFKVGKNPDTDKSIVVGRSCNINEISRMKEHLSRSTDISFFDETVGDCPTAEVVISRYINNLK